MEESTQRMHTRVFLIGSALVVAFILILITLKSGSVPTLPSGTVFEPIFTPGATTLEQKETLSGIVTEAEERPLTPQEKTDILREFGGEKTAFYNLSAEEKAAILRALNNQ